MAILSIGDLMSDKPIAAEPGAKISAVKRLMLEEGVKHVPIVQDGEVVGLVTDRDIKLAQSVSEDPSFHEHATANEVQVDDPYVVEISVPVVEVLGVMIERNIGSVVVIKNGRLCGMFTRFDACRALLDILSSRSQNDG